MIKKNVNKALVVFVLVVILYFAFGLEIAMFSFIAFCQCIGFYSVITELNTYFKSKKGPFTVGRVASIRDVEFDNERSLEVDLSFLQPSTGQTITIKQEFKNIDPNKEIRIWVNESNPLKSVAIAKYDISWIINKVFAILVLLGLFVVDYLILTKGYKP